MRGSLFHLLAHVETKSQTDRTDWTFQKPIFFHFRNDQYQMADITACEPDVSESSSLALIEHSLSMKKKTPFEFKSHKNNSQVLFG